MTQEANQETKAEDNKPDEEKKAEQPKTVFDKPEEKKVELSNVGSDRHYKSVEELDKGYSELAKLNEQMKKENHELRNSVDNAKTTEDVYNLIRDQRNTGMNETKDDEKPNINQDVLQKMIDERVQQTHGALLKDQTFNANKEKVDKQLKEMFADKAPSLYQEKKAELAKLDIDLDQMAKTNPNAVIFHFKPDKPQPSQSYEPDLNTPTYMTPQGDKEDQVWGDKEVQEHIKTDPFNVKRLRQIVNTKGYNLPLATKPGR